MSHFDITLPSNSRENFYPDNTLTRFKTKLHNIMSLKGEWECGLSEILFVKLWNNVTLYGDDKKYNNMHVSCSDCTFYIPGVRGPKFTYGAHVKVEVGYYDAPNVLVSHINEAIEKVFSNSIDTVEGGCHDVSKPPLLSNSRAQSS